MCGKTSLLLALSAGRSGFYAVNFARSQDAFFDQQADQAFLFAAQFVQLAIVVAASGSATWSFGRTWFAWFAARSCVTVIAVAIFFAAAIVAIFFFTIGARSARFEQRDADGFHAFFADFQFVRHAFADLEEAEAFHVDVILVDENVFAAVIRLNEAIAATTIETHNGTGSCHWINPLRGW
jgi:hypothetical protein